MITTNFYGLHNSRSMVKKRSENQYLHVLTNSLSNTQEIFDLHLMIISMQKKGVFWH